MKLYDLDDEKINQLNQVQIYNLSEERSAGFVNYELDIRGKQKSESVSHKMVLDKSADLTIKNSSDFRGYRKPSCGNQRMTVSMEPKNEST